MSDEQNKNLTGVWTGVFDYDSNWGEATPFNAIITEENGVISGEIIEPNTVAQDATPEIFASISGSRAALQVDFIKTYEQRPGAGHSIRYEGVADAKLSIIRGDWMINGGLGGRGPFVMNRANDGAKAEEAVKTEAAELVDAPSSPDGAPRSTVPLEHPPIRLDRLDALSLCLVAKVFRSSFHSDRRPLLGANS